MEVTHRREGSGKTARSVHSVTARRKKLNTSLEMIEGSVTVTFRISDDTTLAVTDYRTLINYLMNAVLAPGPNLDKLLRGEV